MQRALAVLSNLGFDEDDRERIRPRLIDVPQDVAIWLEGMEPASWQFMIAFDLLYLVLPELLAP